MEHGDESAAQAVTSNVGGFAASVATGAVVGTMIGGPVGTVVGTVVGAGVGVFTSGMIDGLWDSGGDVSEAFMAGVDTVADTGEALLDGAADVGGAVVDGIGGLYGATRFHKIRIHGDYHLGQTLKTSSGFVIIDFEGEPATPMAHRRQKHCALKDVAGMLRSFEYAMSRRPIIRRTRPIASGRRLASASASSTVTSNRRGRADCCRSRPIEPR